jgi:signal transduction histidine kinase
MNTLRNKLILSYVLLALFIVASIGLVFNVFLEKLFIGYAIRKQEKQMEQLVASVNAGVSQNFTRGIPPYNQDMFETIGKTALDNGMILHISANGGEVDWDIRHHHLEECQIVLEHARYNMRSVNPKLEGEYQEQKFSLGNDAGIVTIGFYGPYNFNDEDVNLITTINRILINITISSLLLAIGIGVFMAKRLSLPIADVIGITKRIADGDFGARISTQPKTKEIRELVVSVNELSSRLDRVEQMKRRLASDVAHELRTPLTNLLSQTEAMIDGILTPDPKHLQCFYSEIDRLSALVGDLQKLTDIEDASIKLDKKWIIVKPFLDEIVHSFRIELDKKSLAVSLYCPPSLRAYADEMRLTQVFVNILSNAVKYSPERGLISIQAQSENQTTVFSVRDNGCGISEEDLPFIFERFYRADKSRTRNTGGAGIGLAITKALVTAHGGQICAESSINQGTMIRFCI